MRRLFSASFLLSLAMPAPFAAYLAAEDIAITHARIIVGDGPVIPSETIIVRNGKIVSVNRGTADTQGLKVIDAQSL
jgi:imidazolonepropionase-like amidohydrolase